MCAWPPRADGAVVSSVLAVVDMVADTLLICFIADEEIYGKNSAECFAPEGLRKYINSHQSDDANPDMIATSADQA